LSWTGEQTYRGSDDKVPLLRGRRYHPFQHIRADPAGGGPRDRQQVSRLKLVIWIGLAVVLAVGAILLWRAVSAEALIQSLREWIEALGAWGYGALFLAYAVAAVLLIPSWPLSIAAGLAFGALGFVLVPLAGTVGASAAFLIGRYVARDRVEASLSRRPTYQTIDRVIGEEGWKVVFLLRLSPLVPYNLLNYFCAITRVSFPGYAAATLVGVIPGATMYVYLGLLGQVAITGGELSLAQWALAGFGLLATVAVVVLVAARVRKKLQAAGLGEQNQDDATLQEKDHADDR